MKQKRKPLMQLRQIVKKFPNGTVALGGVNLDIELGKVHGLVGSNGAGKSTLIKILSGTYPATSGEILWHGNFVSWNSPKAAADVGIGTVHQHIPLVPTLSVIENVIMGSDRFWRRAPWIRKRFNELCDRIGYRLEPDCLVGDLPIGQRQMVAIFQVLSSGADLIVLDEPTASLASEERDLVYKTVRRLSKVENKAILFVSHFLDEVMELTDCVTVLRDGKAIMRDDTCNLDESQLAEAIVGKEIVAQEKAAIERSASHASERPTNVLLEIKDLTSPGKLQPISFKLSAGEVIGVAGLLGSGRSELLHAIYRADPSATGTVLLDGRQLGLGTGAAVKAGMGLVPEDRKSQGLVPEFEIWRNTTLPALEKVSAFKSILVKERERLRGWDAINTMSIKANSPDILVSELSGGNAQKVTIAKWLFSDSKVLLLDEPTHGIDIGAKTDIIYLVRKLAAKGKGIIIVSSEFEELLAVSDRIIVMRDGYRVAERAVHQTSEHELLLLASGQSATLETA